MTVRGDITVDWVSSPRIIWVAAPSVEITIQDLVDTCRTLEATDEGIDEPHLIDAAGKEFLGGTTYVGLTATLQNAVLAFEARLGPSWILCSIIGGNLVAVDADGNNIDPRYPTAYVSVDRTASASATLQEQTAIQFSSYSGGVTIDITGPYDGTDYPVGTPQQPVNNLDDAVSIALERGFTTFYIVGDITLDDSVDLEDMVVIGASKTKSVITIEDSADVTNCEFYDATITGILDGGNVLKDCIINDLNYVNGYIELCVISGTITLGGGAEAYFLDCWAGSFLGQPPIIDLGGSGQTLVMQNFNGYIKWRNKSGVSDQANASLNAGWIVLEDTITAGQITVIGTGLVEDYSDGATVNTSYLVSPESVADQVWDEAKADHVGGGSFGEEVQTHALSSEVAILPSAADVADAVFDEVAADHVGAGSFGKMLSDIETLAVFIGDIEGGRWRIVSNQMIFYKSDNTTEVARFNLFDSDGNPAMENVFQRQRA